jgi:uncharacterized protein
MTTDTRISTHWPSDDWRSQCQLPLDGIGSRHIEHIGVETLMWASDDRHTDGVWPESSTHLEEPFGHLSADVVHKITCEYAATFDGLGR